MYPLVVDLNFLNNSRYITLPTHSCLVLYSFCACLLHSLIMNNVFVSISSQPTLAIPLCIIDFRFNIIGPYDVILCCYQKRFSFSLKVSFSLSYLNLFVLEFTNLSLEILIHFFSFLFLTYCCSVCPYIVTAVISHCNTSFFAPFIVFKSPPRIDASMLSSKLAIPFPSSFLDT